MAAAGEPRRLEIEVRFDEQPIHGRLYERDGRRDSARPFSGWLGLMSAIEAVGKAGSARPREREEEGQ